MRNRLSLAFAASLLLATAANAAIFEKIEDSEFIRRADGIVIGTVALVEPYIDNHGEIMTRVSIDAGTVIEGDFDVHTPIVINEMGGVIGHQMRIVAGAPNYQPGEKVLVFLTHNKVDDFWNTQTMEMGKFSFAEMADGTSILVRGINEDPSALIWDGNTNRQAIEQPRLSKAFVQYIKDTLAGHPGRRDYLIDAPNQHRARLMSNATTSAVAAPAAAYPASAYVMNNMRWELFEKGGTATYFITGSQPGFDSVGTATRALAAWTNDPNSTVRLALGSGAGGPFVKDGINSIVYNSTTNVPAGAIGYAQAYALDQNVYNGETFWTIVEGDVVMKAGISMSATAFDEAVTHEVGHTIGFRHSDEGTPASNDAVMNSTVFGTHGANLAAWDREAVAAVYGPNSTPPPPSGCTPPAITAQPAASTTITSGQSVTLSVTASGTTPFTYYWYRVGSTGSVLLQSGPSSTLTVSPTATTDYFVWVYNNCGAVESNTARVTVSTCSSPTITAQPTSRTISSGQSTTLTVTATGTGPLTYYWYLIGSNGGSVLVQSGPSASVTVAPTTTTDYFVWVYGCGTPAQSNVARVTVSSCSGPTITAQPTSRTISSGQSTTLTVTATGTGPLTYYWYLIGSNGGSVLIQSGPSASVTVAPTTTTDYFVWVYGCGTPQQSNAVRVTVSSCSGPTITGQPTSRTISSGQSTTLTVTATGTAPLAYYWYLIGSNGGSVLVQSGPSASVTVAPTTTTDYFVWVYGPCGSPVQSNAVRVTVTNCSGPTITGQPTSRTISAGQSTTLTVTATGTAPLAYYWYRIASNGGSVLIQSGPSASVTVAPTTTTDYFVWVYGCGSPQLSNAVRVTVK